MSDNLDPVTLEVIRNAFPAIANEMAADLQRTSYNMMIYEVRDFCTAIVKPDGELVSQNVGGVSHFVADLGVIITDGFEKTGDQGFSPEDVIITNHQKVAGQHLNNIVIYMPFFFKGELMFFTMVRAHWIDVGGMSTGFGGGAGVTDPWMEGLQLDQLKIYERGVRNETLYKIIRDNIRFPESSLGDMRSQMAACRLATRRLEELFEKFGSDTIHSALDQVFDETEQKCRNVVLQIPDGVYEAESCLNDDGVQIGEPVRVHAKVTVKGSDMEIDLSGCSDERKSGVNSRTYAGARVAYKALTAPTEPVNEGSFRALSVVIPEGNIMMARYPAPMGMWSMVVPTVVDTIVKALAPGMKDNVPAGHFGILGGPVVFTGTHPKTKRRFIVQSIEGGGWGGRPFEDGESATVSVCQGDVRNATIEGIELKCPVMIESRRLRADSGGPGKYRGGFGMETTVRNFVEGDWICEPPKRGDKCPAWGLWGGKAGAIGGYHMRQPGESDFTLVETARHTVPEETQVIVRTGGGGGWGDPLEREAELVRSDVTQGLVSVAGAREHYGVVIGAKSLELDADATETLRAEMKK
ncbi:MAG: hydantoinase B/oxoprolinase family protein [Rhodospirillales bacterium]|jgi:N-methylhydantoinase B|nr:hydantoinase B/oxoprolinase family protein [Rhodospirillales bacterium]MDP6644971.1 hydantoinase B/oxoprolinase family protein [Rhodospirillales bacterium]MDP6840663.1 hydantoinase B/oxoprolinase family protein [Rhodospirillales bacterium]